MPAATVYRVGFSFSRAFVHIQITSFSRVSLIAQTPIRALLRLFPILRRALLTLKLAQELRRLIFSSAPFLGGSEAAARNLIACLLVNAAPDRFFGGCRPFLPAIYFHHSHRASTTQNYTRPLLKSTGEKPPPPPCVCSASCCDDKRNPGQIFVRAS